MLKSFYIYLMIINLVTYFFYSYDKNLSKKRNVIRISEKFLLTLSVIGGGLGGYLAMIFRHHKTKHWYFAIGIPVICFLQLAVAGLVYRSF